MTSLGALCRTGQWPTPRDSTRRSTVGWRIVSRRRPRGGPKTNNGKLPVISLFSGAMGLDLGLEAAGLEIAVALECNRFPVATIRKNRPDLPLIDRPIEDV